MSGMEDVKEHEHVGDVSQDSEIAMPSSQQEQGVEKPKGPLEKLRPKLQSTQQQTRYRKSQYAPSDGEGTHNDTHAFA
ncbi:hypothetical protein Vadar_002047 [Vaccinium darrowii]|uniref:Uncharacterized protein n=1 Tax=Vaccinium darrowii TaxID=229202 RepID=A0ACB7Z8V1_9ERIC|nr:hypothetical protein Vadar_002047 [Vaccinium darrowii]